VENEHSILLKAKLKSVSVDQQSLRADIAKLNEDAATKNKAIKLKVKLDSSYLKTEIKRVANDLPPIKLNIDFDASKVSSRMQSVLKALKIQDAEFEPGGKVEKLNEEVRKLNAELKKVNKLDLEVTTDIPTLQKAKSLIEETVQKYQTLNKQGLNERTESAFLKQQESALKKVDEITVALKKQGAEIKSNADSINKSGDKVKDIVFTIKAHGIEKVKSQIEDLKNTTQDGAFRDFNIDVKSIKHFQDGSSSVKLYNEELNQAVIATIKFNEAAGKTEMSFGNGFELFDSAKMNRDLELASNNLEKMRINKSAAFSVSGIEKEWERIRDKLEEVSRAPNSDRIKEVQAEIAQLNSKIDATGKSGKSMVDGLEHSFKRLGQYLISSIVYGVIVGNIRAIQKNVYDLEFALRDVERISGITGTALNRMFDEAAEKAIRLGSSIKDILGSIRDWTRLGLAIEDAMGMAEASTLLSRVGVMSLDKATEGLISTTKAYHVAAKDALSVVDQIIATDVTQPISSEGILDVLRRSSAAMASANGTLEENIALGVAMNSVLQDASRTGTALNTVVMRLRNVSGVIFISSAYREICMLRAS
jgi:uncharacterized protein YukE